MYESHGFIKMLNINKQYFEKGTLVFTDLSKYEQLNFYISKYSS